MSTQTVLVTGASGFLGNAVAKAFARSGWRTYGLVRQQSFADDLWLEEIIPVIGSTSDTSSFIDALPLVDLVVNTTEDNSNYTAHFDQNTAFFRELAARRADAISDRNHKLLVIFTSGCKDYGMTLRHGEAGLRPHTEESTLNPPWFLRHRTEGAPGIFDFSEDFDAVITRPTTFYGLSGTYYGAIFDSASRAVKANGGSGILRVTANENSIMHGTHVCDVATAYVALANSPRNKITGQIFNISSRRYETAQEIAEAIENSYGIHIKFTGSKDWSDEPTNLDILQITWDFTQWVDSQKIRGVTGWKDCMPLLTEDFDRYRGVYEAFVRSGDRKVRKIQELSTGGSLT